MKKENYVKYVKLAEKLIDKYGTELTVTCGIDFFDQDKPYKPSQSEEVTYTTTGVIIPPVRGIYFQGTRFGMHSEIYNGLEDDKMSCFLLPVYDEQKKPVDLSLATHVTCKDVTGNDITQGPTWVRPDSLIADFYFNKQVVGHTPLKKPPLISHKNGLDLIVVDDVDHKYQYEFNI